MEGEPLNLCSAPSAHVPADVEFGALPAAAPRSPSVRLLSLALWAASGLALSASVLLLPIGLLLLLPAVAGFAYLATRPHVWPEVLGIGAGLATALAYVGYRNRDLVPCEEGAGVAVMQPGDPEFSCGGIAPEPWLLAAGILAGVSAATYAVALWRKGKRG